MAENTKRRSRIPMRIQNMMNKINGDSVEPARVQRRETNPINSSTIEISSSHTGNDFVQLLYQEPYPTTSQVFNKFNETLTTYEPAPVQSHETNQINSSTVEISSSHTGNDFVQLLSQEPYSTTSQEFDTFNEMPTTYEPASVQRHETNQINTTKPNQISSTIEISTRYTGNDFVQLLYQEPYSMTSQVFNKFNETPTTYDSQADDILKRTIENFSEPVETNFLFCDEPMSSFTHDCVIPEILDFDSDDSVKDKNYQPSKEEYSSDDSEYGCNKQILNVKKSKILKSKTSIKSFPKKIITRRHTVEFIATNENIVRNRSSNKRRITIDRINDTPMESVSVPLPPPTKRKKYNTSLSDRSMQKKKERLDKYAVKTGCENKCTKRCASVFTADERVEINKMYWLMTHSQKRQFIRDNYTVAVPKRKYTHEAKRNPKRTFTLQRSNGVMMNVCKVFFLTTLGFNKTNDKILINSLDSIKDTDRRGIHAKTPAYNRDIITEHIESFHPAAPHYRREHAPHRRYLPSEINITFMYSDFCAKYPEHKCGYELYRKHLKSLKISFTRLGNEECETCETYRLHSLETKHDARADLVPDCKACLTWGQHHNKYKSARELYDLHKTLEQNTQQMYFSSDLEKVIMLPRLDTFKSVIFCPRLTAYNQTFAPVGKITKNVKPLAAIWHDGIAGRKQNDIMSAYYTFFMKYRDIKSLHLWLDNCTAQNKNWLLFSMFTDLVNSDLIDTDSITLHFFEPGHTFMSSDQFHHQVELSMKRKKCIYDFTDFEDAVASANQGRVHVKSMQPQDFLNCDNNVSDRRIQNSSPKAYITKMVQVSFQRGTYDLQYKYDFNDEYVSLKFLNDKYLKNPNFIPKFRTLPKGIDEERKKNILGKLTPIIPKHKIVFWQNLPISDEKQGEQNRRRTK